MKMDFRLIVLRATLPVLYALVHKNLIVLQNAQEIDY